MLKQTDLFTKRFKYYNTPFPEIVPSLNILLFGTSGTGKSSFINSILTSLLPSYCRSLVEDEIKVDRNTQNIRCIPLSQNFDQLKYCNINLWDTSGIDEYTFNYELLSEILHGNIPDQFEMIKTINGKNIPCSFPRSNDINRTSKMRIHGVFLFASIGILEDILMCNKFKNILQEINREDIIAEIIITRADTIRSTNYIKTLIAKHFNYPENRVHFVISNNYRNTLEKNFHWDKVTFNIFNNMVDLCERNIKSLVSKEKIILNAYPDSFIPYKQKVYKKILVKRSNDDTIILCNVVDQSIEEFERISLPKEFISNFKIHLKKNIYTIL